MFFSASESCHTANVLLGAQQTSRHWHMNISKLSWTRNHSLSLRQSGMARRSTWLHVFFRPYVVHFWQGDLVVIFICFYQFKISEEKSTADSEITWHIHWWSAVYQKICGGVWGFKACWDSARELNRAKTPKYGAVLSIMPFGSVSWHLLSSVCVQTKFESTLWHSQNCTSDDTKNSVAKTITGWCRRLSLGHIFLWWCSFCLFLFHFGFS